LNTLFFAYIFLPRKTEGLVYIQTGVLKHFQVSLLYVRIQTD